MRVRALDVLSARIDGVPVAVHACTLAVRTDADGRRGWDASGWARGAPPALAARAEGGRPIAVSLETDDGTVHGEAFVSVGGGGVPREGGAPVFLAGVGSLVPWPA